MHERHRVILNFELLEFAPFAAAMLITAVLAAVGVLPRWFALSVLGIGAGASLGSMIMAARGIGVFANAPLMVRVQAKIWLASGLFAAVTLGTVAVTERWLPDRLN